MTSEHFRNVLVCGILIIGAILTASYSLTESNNWKHIQNQSGRVDGVITAITPSAAGRYKQNEVWVNYTVDGRDYNSRLATYTKDMEVGKRIRVYYDKEDPIRTVSRPTYIDMLYFIAAIQLVSGAAILIIDPE